MLTKKQLTVLQEVSFFRGMYYKTWTPKTCKWLMLHGLIELNHSNRWQVTPLGREAISNQERPDGIDPGTAATGVCLGLPQMRADSCGANPRPADV